MRQNTFIIAWILFLVNLNKICDHFHKLFVAHGRRVQTEIIISGVIPVSSGIIAVIFRAVLVDFLNPLLRFLLRETSRSQAAPIVQVHPILLTPPVRPNNAKEAYNRYSQEQDEPHKAPPQKR